MKVAKSFVNYEYDESKAYKKEGKLYVKAKCKCPRCGGLGIIVARVENDQLIPIPVDQGICYQCLGAKVVTKEIRLYTDEEYARMEKANAKAAEKREAEREAKIKAEYADNKRKWIADNGFNEEGNTFIYAKNDSYDVKEDLKAVGFKFSYPLMWHISSVPAGYEDKVICVTLDEIVEFSAWGKGTFKTGTKENIEKRLKGFDPIISEWFGNAGEHFDNVIAILKSIKAVQTRWGISNLVTFVTENNEILNWWTTVTVTAEVGSKIFLSGNIKDHTEYNETKITTVSRCKLKEIK